jgi:hypothetical protein
VNVGDLIIERDIVPHPLLGEAHVIRDRTGVALTAMSVLDWDRPTEIPTIAAPGALPPGEGALLLNTIAELARRAGVPALRYAGPYPTPALYRALARSFRTHTDEATFTADVVGRALRVARDPLPIDFAPAPHVRVRNAHGFAELRDGVERAVIAGIGFERTGSPGRLVEHHAELWFGDTAWARVATLAPTGELVAGPWPLPAVAVPAAEFPPPLRAALAELVADAVPAPLAADARTAVTARTLAWADLGGRVARATPTGFEVHAVLWERVAPLGLARLALAIVEALAPIVTSTLVAELVAATS